MSANKKQYVINGEELELDLALIRKTISLSVDILRTQSYHTGVRYLDGQDLVARAWITAFLSALASCGYEIVKKVDKNPKV